MIKDAAILLVELKNMCGQFWKLIANPYNVKLVSFIPQLYLQSNIFFLEYTVYT